jgi:hypothetical protein
VVKKWFPTAWLGMKAGHLKTMPTTNEVSSPPAENRRSGQNGLETTLTPGKNESVTKKDLPINGLGQI